MRNLLIPLVVPCLLAAVACGSDGAGDDTGDVVDMIQQDTAGPDDGTDAVEDTSRPDALNDLQSDIWDDIPDVPPPDTVIEDVDSGVDARMCESATPIQCGETVSGNTALSSVADLWNGYSCTARLEDGPEAMYLLTSDKYCTATVTLSGLSDDLDVMHLSECDPWQCAQVSSTPIDIQDDETIQFTVKAGTGELIVIDGYDDSQGPYSLSVTCECPQIDECPPYLSRLAECPFRYGTDVLFEPYCPDSAACLDGPCVSDADCTAVNSPGTGPYCVTGNCVYCWQDSQCDAGLQCRGGRCVADATTECPAIPDCEAAGCTTLNISDTDCPACVCETEFFNQCATDDECLLVSHHPFKRCINGRCGECRVDSDCGEGQQCLPPGMCFSMLTHPSAIYGTWLIGWYGGLDHFSWFRFEPDGTMRRASYESDGLFMDDILTGGCVETDGVAIPAIVGTWQPEQTESGFLVIRISFLSECGPETPVSVRYVIGVSEDGNGLTLTSVENPEGVQLVGTRMNPLLCNPDFTECPLPSYDAAQEFLPVPPDGKFWRLTFGDEFNGTAIDETKWNLEGGTMADPAPRRSGYWVKEAMTLDGAGNLVMATWEQDGKYYDGVLSTLGTFTQAFGYFEARMKSSVEPGHWGAFWMMPESFGQTDNGGVDGVEIDIMERPWTGENATWTNHALHWDAYREGADASEISVTEGIVDGWHTYGLWWTPDWYRFYIDGRLVWETTAGGVCQTPLYLILSDEVQSNAFIMSGAIEDATLPDYTYVDYVRVYELAD